MRSKVLILFCLAEQSSADILKIVRRFFQRSYFLTVMTKIVRRCLPHRPAIFVEPKLQNLKPGSSDDPYASRADFQFPENTNIESIFNNLHLDTILMMMPNRQPPPCCSLPSVNHSSTNLIKSKQCLNLDRGNDLV